MNTKTLTRIALFASMALIIHILESYLPPLAPIPGIKIGFANVITLAAIYILGIREAFWILLVRIILGGFFAGQMMSFMYSLAGGMLCYIVTVLLKRFFSKDTMWALGVVGAIFHNLGQIACASFILRSFSVLYYGIVLGAVSCITGTFTGILARYMVLHFGKLKK